MNNPSRSETVIPGFKMIKPVLDVVITIIAWLYYTLGFVLFFSPFYVAVSLFSTAGERGFQKLNRLFYHHFFKLVAGITPGLTCHIPETVHSIHSSVVVCNHVSYLDPILLISIFPRQKTIVKHTFFRVPILGWLLKRSGYLPSTTREGLDVLMIEQMQKMDAFLRERGVLFIFPEGTRSRDGRIGGLNPGAFKIARQFHAPITVLRIRNTNHLFRPGRFRFNTCVTNPVSIERLGVVNPDESGQLLSTTELMTRTRSLMLADP
ncbi:MAG: lysophospholipid acyltransferase family protein [Desulfatirhabdiaceae bacterium]